MTYSISQTHCRFLHIYVDQYRWKSNRVAPAVHLLPGVSVVVLLSSCACWRPSRYTAMPSYMGIHLWDRSELCCLCRHGEEEGARIRESSQPAAPSSASPCVSRSPGSFQQPLSNRRAWERTRGDGRCLEDWNGHGTASRAPPPPTCLTAASGHAAAGVSVRFLFASSACECVRFCAFAHQCRLLSVLCVGGKKRVCLLPHC